MSHKGLSFKLLTGVSVMLEGIWFLILQLRLWKGKEPPEWIEEKWAKTTLKRPPNKLVWVHAASIGEARSVLGFIQKLLSVEPHLTVLLTTVTKDSAKLFRPNLPKGVIHQLFPIDAPRVIRRFLDHWQPEQVFFVESDFWPFLLWEVRRRGIKTILLNGRLSIRSFSRWTKLPWIGKQLLAGFQICLTPSMLQKKRLEALGAPCVQISKNLKLTLPPLRVESELLVRLKAACQERPTWLASNTHSGEEELMIKSHLNLLRFFPNLLLFLCPRHVQRSEEIESLLNHYGVVFRRFSSWHPHPQSPSFEGVQVVLGDTLGHVGEFYSLHDLVVMGGSFAPHIGGHNLVEPAQQDCCIIHGPFMELNIELAEAFQQARAAISTSPQGLQNTLTGLLKDPHNQRPYQQRAKALITSPDQILDEVVKLVWT